MPETVELRPENGPTTDEIADEIAQLARDHELERLASAAVRLGAAAHRGDPWRPNRITQAVIYARLAAGARRLFRVDPALYQQLAELGLDALQIGAWWPGDPADEQDHVGADEARRHVRDTLGRGPGIDGTPRSMTGAALLAQIDELDRKARGNVAAGAGAELDLEDPLRPVLCLGCSRAIGDFDDDDLRRQLCAMCLQDDDLVDELDERRAGNDRRVDEAQRVAGDDQVVARG